MNNLPPGPQSPILWQSLRWILDPIKFQDYCQRLYGDNFTLRLVDSIPRVIIGTPEDIKEIFSLDSQDFDAGCGNQLLVPLLGKMSLFTIDGELHQQHRQLLMPPFHYQHMTNYAETIWQITKQIKNQWSINEPLFLRSQMQKISLEIIIKLIFGINDDSQRYQEIKELIIRFLRIIDSPLKSAMIYIKLLRLDWGKWTWWGQLKATQTQIYNLLDSEIKLRRNYPRTNKNENILNLLINAQDETGNILSDREIKDELITLFLAGHETLTTSLTWSLLEIHLNQEIKRNLEQEIKNLEEQEDLNAIAKLPYIIATVAETLRKYPIAPIISPRVLKKPLIIGKYEYPAKTFLCPSIYLVHYREEIYSQAQKFQPQRFINHKYAPYEYFPFGGGNRRCIGYALAQLEMKLIISFILENHQLKFWLPENLQMKRRGFSLTSSQEIKFQKTV